MSLLLHATSRLLAITLATRGGGGSGRMMMMSVGMTVTTVVVGHLCAKNGL